MSVQGRRVVASTLGTRVRSWRLIRRPLQAVIVHALLVIVGCVMAVPVFWALATSLKTFKEVIAYPPVYWPPTLHWENYRPVFVEWDFFVYARNSCIITFGSSVGHVASAAFCAYGFAKLRSPVRDALFVLVLSTMMLPGFVTFIPVFLMFHRLGLVNTFAPFLIPPWLGGGAWNIFLLRQFFRTLPDNLLDAARVDGASELRIFAQIVVPLAKPALATVFFFSFMGGWNDYFGPYIYLTKMELWPLSLALAALPRRIAPYLPAGTIGNMTQNIMMAASLAITLPLVVVFLFTQRYFVEGIAITGMKA